jgi:heat shock protein 1/8
VYEGERALAADNHFLGEFTIINLPRGPKGSIGFKVIFNIDADGILHVVAEETSTGRKGSVTIAGSDLEEEEVERMIKEAERFRAEDEAIRRQVAVKRQLEGYVYEI